MLQPLHDFVLLDPEPVQSYEQQKGFKHIIVPDRYRVGPTDPPIYGTVLAVGSHCRRVQRGQRILIGKFSGARIPLEGNEQVILVKEDDVLAVVTNGSQADRQLCRKCRTALNRRFP